ncbi:hypothetical protein Bca4012_005868 [Brassica carinata]
MWSARNLPDLSALLGSRLGGSSSNRPPTAPVIREEPRTTVESSVSIPESTSIRPASDSSAATGREGSSEAVVAGTQSDEPPKKKTKKPKKKKKIVEDNVTEDQTGPDGEHIDHVGGVQDRVVAVQEDSSDGARTGGDQDGSPITPLTRKKKEKRADNWAASNALVVIEQGEKSGEEIPPPSVGLYTFGESRRDHEGVLEISDSSQEDQSGSADERRDIEPVGDDAGMEPTELGIAVNEEAVSTEKQIEPTTRRSFEVEPTPIEEVLPTEKDGDETAIASSEVPEGTSIPDGATGE